MKSVEISLVMPSKLGGRVMSRQSIRQAVSESPGLQTKSVGSEEIEEGVFRDFGATLVLLAGTAAGLAAVRGFFDVIKTVIQEAYRTRRERYGADAELRKIKLLLAHETTEFDLDEPLENLEKQLEGKRLEACKQMESYD